LFASGAAALVYQILWIKQLSLVVGVDVYAITIGVSAFFLGLAIGSAIFGRVADRVARPVRLYAVLEFGVAVLGITVTVMLPKTAHLFAAIEAEAGLLAWIMVFVIVAAPALLMGGTLPTLLRALAPRGADIGAAGGRLYAANTAGAIVAALLASFLLIPSLGVRGSAFAAAAINIAATLSALLLDRSHPAREPMQKQADAARTSDARIALALYAIAGGLAIGYEVIWTQTIVQFMSTRAFAFSIVLATYLTGLAIGSILCAQRADRIGNPWGVFGLLIAGAGIIALLEVALLGRWLIYAQTALEAGVLATTGNGLAGMCARFAVAAACIVLVPTILLGAAFPLALRLSVKDGREGSGIGAVLAWNTLGGIAGAMLTGLVLVPLLGLVRTLAALAIGAAIIGACGAWRGTSTRSASRWVTVTLGLAAGLGMLLIPRDQLATLLPGARGGTIAFYEESRGATVAVVERPAGPTQFRRLYIQGVSNSGDAMPSVRYMRLQALLPLLIHRGEPKSVLVIGFGTGITAGALLAYPSLEQRVVAELLPAVVRAAPLFHGNFSAASDPKIDIRLRDGRRELLHSDQRYDVITLEPPPPSAAGVVNLYSIDFYQLAAARLNDKGLLAQWLPIHAQNDEDSRSLVRSFVDVFPYASLWTTEMHEMLLIGSLQPMELDASRIAARFNRPETTAALREVGVASPAALLATWVTDRIGLERYVDGAPRVTDDEPRIEYATWVREKEVARVLPRLLALRAELPLRGADNVLPHAVTEERDRLLTFYAAGLHAYDGDRESWARDMRRTLVEDGANPYYRWFAGPGQ
jgi:predicted membrane-bound spermidine synthase